MQLTSLILGLVASASAIDITLHQKISCKGISYVYANRGPNQCTQNGENWASASFTYIPKNWNIRCKIHKLKGCDSGSLWGAVTSNGNTKVCMGPGENIKVMRGAKYEFVNKRRGVVARAEDQAEECKGPDFLVLEDGTKFNVAGLDESALHDMYLLAENGTALPENLMALRV